MSKRQNWPSISICESDQDIVREISQYQGILRGTDTKDILMIAASLAVDMDIPEVPIPAGEHKKDIMHQSLLRSEAYREYRQYMLLIYYLTAGQRDLKTMSDFKAIVDNFVDYAHRGLQLLKTSYLKAGGPEQFEDKFAEAIGKCQQPILN